MSKEYKLLKELIETLPQEKRKPYLDALKKLNRPSIENQIIRLIDDLGGVSEDLENRLVDFQEHDKTWYAADVLGDCVNKINEYIEYVDNYKSDVIDSIELGKRVADSDGIEW